MHVSRKLSCSDFATMMDPFCPVQTTAGLERAHLVAEAVAAAGEPIEVGCIAFLETRHGQVSTCKHLAKSNVLPIQTTYPIRDRASTVAAGRRVPWVVIDLSLGVSYATIGWCSRKSAALAF